MSQAVVAAIPAHRSVDLTRFLSDEVMEKILSFLPRREVGKNAVAVCRAWKEVLDRDLTSYHLAIGRNQPLMARSIAEIPLMHFPRELLVLMRDMRMNILKIPRVDYEGSVSEGTHSMVGHQAPLTLYSATAQHEFHKSGKKMVLRAMGDTRILEQIFTHFRMHRIIPKGTAACAIFERNHIQLDYFVRISDSDEMAVASGARGINYRELGKLFRNPHSLIWLYCADEATAYVDLSVYFHTGYNLVLY